MGLGLCQIRPRLWLGSTQKDVMDPIRSLLLCTVTFERHVQSALASPADAVVLDLETTVAEPDKAAAREAARKVMAGQHRPDIFIRINEIDSPHVLDDLLGNL